MEVILNCDVDKLGKSGSVIKVKDGFARNYLIPNKLAVPLTPANLNKLEKEKEKKRLQLEKSKKESEACAARLAGLSLTIAALIHEGDRLYGGIGAQDIANALKEEGIEIDKGAIILQEPIKSLGIYEIPVRLHPEVSANIKVWVVKK